MAWWRRHFMSAEGGTVAVLTIALGVWVYLYDGAKYFSLERSSDNIAVVAAFVGLFGTLMGLIIAAITFLFGIVDKEAFKVLRGSLSYPDHWAIFRSCLRACAIATLVSASALVALWIRSLPIGLLILMFASVMLAIARIGRVVWVVQNMIDAEVRMGNASRQRVDK